MSKDNNTQDNTKKDGAAPPKDQKDADKKALDEKGRPLSDQDIALFKRYGKGPYTEPIKKVEEDIRQFNQKISALCGVKESDTGLALPSQWNLQQD